MHHAVLLFDRSTAATTVSKSCVWIQAVCTVDYVSEAKSGRNFSYASVSYCFLPQVHNRNNNK